MKKLPTRPQVTFVLYALVFIVTLLIFATYPGNVSFRLWDGFQLDMERLPID